MISARDNSQSSSDAQTRMLNSNHYFELFLLSVQKLVLAIALENCQDNKSVYVVSWSENALQCDWNSIRHFSS